MKSVHQVVDTLVPGDAISNDCIQIHAHLLKLGYKTNIYARASLVHNKYILDYRKGIPTDSNIIFHHSTNSPLVDFVAKLKQKKILIYHNITPPAYFREYNPDLYKIFIEATRQNYLLHNAKFDGIIGDSNYNLQQIKEFTSAKHETVIPPFLFLQFPKRMIKEKNDEETERHPYTMMFVGRFAPNKKQLDIVKIFEYYSKFLNPKARLVLIGTYSYANPYFHEILDYIKRRDIQNITIKGALTSEQLADTYTEADILLCMSEHEGFCIPVLESLYFDVPVLAYKIPALQELIDDEYLVPHKNYKEIGDMLYKIEKNPEYRKKMLEDQKKILGKFESEEIKNKFMSFITKVFEL